MSRKVTRKKTAKQSRKKTSRKKKPKASGAKAGKSKAKRSSAKKKTWRWTAKRMEKYMPETPLAAREESLLREIEARKPQEPGP